MNQRNKADAGKMNPLLLFKDLYGPLQSVLAVLSYGAEKYTPGGWRTVEPERYQAALLRHINSWLSGESRDPETGLHHLSHATTNCLFLLWFEMQGKLLSSYTTYAPPPQDHKRG